MAPMWIPPVLMPSCRSPSRIPAIRYMVRCHSLIWPVAKEQQTMPINYKNRHVSTAPKSTNLSSPWNNVSELSTKIKTIPHSEEANSQWYSKIHSPDTAVRSWSATSLQTVLVVRIPWILWNMRIEWNSWRDLGWEDCSNRWWWWTVCLGSWCFLELWPTIRGNSRIVMVEIVSLCILITIRNRATIHATNVYKVQATPTKVTPSIPQINNLHCSPRATITATTLIDPPCRYMVPNPTTTVHPTQKSTISPRSPHSLTNSNSINPTPTNWSNKKNQTSEIMANSALTVSDSCNKSIPNTSSLSSKNKKIWWKATSNISILQYSW